MPEKDIRKYLFEKTAESPDDSGVYIMRDKNGNILYIGKAKNLKKRLSSYFRRKEKDSLKTRILVSKVNDFEVIVTSNEKEAFLLESTLIKKDKPKYNIILKDDKAYPYVRLELDHKFPKFSIVRKVRKDGAKYFGPFSSAGSIRHTLKFIHKTFRLRTCKNTAFDRRERPCLNYQMGLCQGPCVYKIDEKEYMNNVSEAVLVLNGKAPFLLKKIEKEMMERSLERDFEKAAILRDKLFALEKSIEKQSVITTDVVDRDFIAVSGFELNKVISIFRIRGGAVSWRRNYNFRDAAADPEDILESFIKQYYEKTESFPKEIAVNFELPEKLMLESFLADIKGSKVKIIRPLRGEKKSFLNIAVENAISAQKELDLRENSRKKLLKDLQFYLGMKTLPERIECFDNSNISGTNPVSAMVVYEKGVPAHSEYRKYNLEYRGKPDDYAYMHEVLFKRFSKKDKPLPDLLLVDGGKGQLNIAIDILKDLNLDNSFTIAGIAKKNEAAGENSDKIYLPYRKNPVLFHNRKYLLYFLMEIRDSAHNNVINFHRKKRKKAMKKSALDNIRGLGPKRKKLLLAHFGSFKNIKAASFDEIKSIKGISQETAKNIYNRFH
ncbi:MAG: excinuclease ABC subunit C [Deltaproteobacteria bacterium]|nr:MAG: excinuclease ABC subunit C [Deltaproteobacteria bacterium]